MLALLSLVDGYAGMSSTNVHLRAAAGRGGRVLVPDASPGLALAGRRHPAAAALAFVPYRQGRDGGWQGALAQLRGDLEREGPR